MQTNQCEFMPQPPSLGSCSTGTLSPALNHPEAHEVLDDHPYSSELPKLVKLSGPKTLSLLILPLLVLPLLSSALSAS